MPIAWLEHMESLHAALWVQTVASYIGRKWMEMGSKPQQYPSDRVDIPQINGTGYLGLEAWGAFFPPLCQTWQETVPRSLVSAHQSGMDPRTRSIVPATNLGSKQKWNPCGAIYVYLLVSYIYQIIYLYTYPTVEVCLSCSNSQSLNRCRIWVKLR